MKTFTTLIIAGLIFGAPARAQDSEERDSQIVGVELKHSDGGFMGLAVEGNALALRFYDDEKQLIDPPIKRATAWWKPRNQSGRERVVLNVAGAALRSPPKVRPPLVFAVVLTLLDENGQATGSYRFKLAGLRKTETQKAPTSAY